MRVATVLDVTQDLGHGESPMIGARGAGHVCGWTSNRKHNANGPVVGPARRIPLRDPLSGEDQRTSAAALRTAPRAA